MDSKIFSSIWSAALNSCNRDGFISDWALSSIWGDQAEGDALAARAEQCKRIWDLAHMSVADIRHTTGLSQSKFAEAFCIPRHTVINWEQRGGCADYVRLMLARLCGLADGLLLGLPPIPE